MRYRRLTGLLLLWAIVPLPFLYIVMPPFWLTAAAVGLLLAVRPKTTVRLSPAIQNLLAVVIVVVVIEAGGVRVGPLRPLGHLLLLLVAVRALLVADRRSMLRVMPALFLVWVVSLAASTHITALVYFALSAVIWWWTGMQLHLLGVLERTTRSEGSMVRPAHAVAAAAVALLLAVPVFLVMPRLRSPWIAGRGGSRSVTGFSSRVELSGVGTIRQSQREALIIRSPRGERIRQEWSRLRATAFERVTVDSWAPRRADQVARVDDGLIWVHREAAPLRDAVELEIVLHRPDRYLFVPTAAVAVSSPVPVHVDPAGGLSLAGDVEGPLTYSVWVTRGEVPPFVDPPHTAGPTFEPPPEVRRLAERITEGLAGAAGRAAAVESYLEENYQYSLQGMSRIGPDPVSWFLLRSRSGHCEYFAGGMVVLLDALGVPARMVGGYSGGFATAAGDEVVVREANAHTWVEVWLGGELGWRQYDPTPAAAVPALAGARSALRLRYLWEWVQAGWDRYVLTYGLGEQLQLLAVLGEAVTGLADRIRPRHLLGLAGTAAAVWLAFQAGRRLRPRRVVGRRRRTPAAAAVERLRRRLERSGAEVPHGATVRWIGRAAGQRWPAAADGVSRLVLLAELELYSAAGGGPAHEARRLWRGVRRGLGSGRRGVTGRRRSP